MSAIYEWLADQPPERRSEVVDALDQCERNELGWHWPLTARPEQLAPPGDWRTWLIMAGRGFGKTRAGAEWVRQVAEENCEARIALVSSSLAEARSVMVEGESGILACSPPDRRPVFEASLRKLRFPNGAQAQLFSANDPESLRGPQHSHAWCDEIGKWPLANDRAVRSWNNLLMGMRLGDDPRLLATTTPRAVPLVQRLLDGEANDKARFRMRMIERVLTQFQAIPKDDLDYLLEKLDAYAEQTTPPLSDPDNANKLVRQNGHLYYSFPLGSSIASSGNCNRL